MGFETFGLAERHRRRPQRTQLVWPAFEDRGSLHEVEHREARRESCRARRRQHMVGAADIVADRLGRVSGSAWASRSAAIQSALRVWSAFAGTSEGPAIVSMPALPNAGGLAAAA